MAHETWERRHKIWLALSLCVWIPIVTKAIRKLGTENDFSFCYDAAAAIASGASPYGPELPYFYPPLLALLLVPLSWLPLALAGAIWLLLKIPILYYSANVFAPRDGWSPELRRAWILAAPVLVFRFLDSDLVTGNCNVYLLGGVTLCVDLARRSGSFAAAAALAAVVAVKPSPLYLVPMLFSSGRRKLAVAAALLVPLLLWGPSLLLPEPPVGSRDQFAETVASVLRVEPLPGREAPGDYQPGQSLRPLIHRWTRPIDATSHDRKIVTINFVEWSRAQSEWTYRALAIALAIFGLAWARRKPLEWSVAWGLVLLLLISPYARKAQFVFVLPALLLLIHALAVGRLSPFWGRATLIVYFVLCQLSTRAVWGKDLSKWWVGWGVIGLGALVLLPALARTGRSVAAATPSPPDEVRATS